MTYKHHFVFNNLVFNSNILGNIFFQWISIEFYHNKRRLIKNTLLINKLNFFATCISCKCYQDFITKFFSTEVLEWNCIFFPYFLKYFHTYPSSPWKMPVYVTCWLIDFNKLFVKNSKWIIEIKFVIFIENTKKFEFDFCIIKKSKALVIYKSLNIFFFTYLWWININSMFKWLSPVLDRLQLRTTIYMQM